MKMCDKVLRLTIRGCATQIKEYFYVDPFDLFMLHLYLGSESSDHVNLKVCL